MNNRFTLQELAGVLATQTGRTKKESEEFLREFITVVVDGAFTDRIVKVKGLGTFKVIEVEDRESVNVNSGQRFIIPGHYKFNFTPDKELKELVNKPFSFFDTTEIQTEESLQELTATTEESLEETEEGKAVEAEPVIAPIEVAKEKEPQPIKKEKEVVRTEKPKNNKRWLLIILILLVAALGVFAYYLLEKSKQSPSYSSLSQTEKVREALLEKSEKEIVEPEPEVEVEPEPAKPEQTTSSDDLPKILGYETIEPGTRLTLIALEYYQHKVFWVYIYEYNKEQIKDPNNIPVGTKLAIPAPEVYGIDAKNRESIEKASLLQTQIIAGER